MKKYTITKKKKTMSGIVLFQIQANVNISQFDIKKGDCGGWIASEKNLSQEGSPSGRSIILPC